MPKSTTREIAVLPPKRVCLKVRFFPICFFFVYLNVTVLLFAFGPWKWPVQNGTKLYIFLALAHMALLVGYTSGAFKQPGGYSGRWSVNRILLWSVTANLVLLIPTAIFRTGNALPDLTQALSNPGAAYAQSLNLRDSSTPMIEYLRMLVGPFLVMLLPLAVFYWRFLRIHIRTAGSLVVVGTLSLFIGMGTNKLIGETALLIPAIIFASHCAGVIRLRLLSWFFVATLGTLLFLGFFIFFTQTMLTRSGSGASSGYFNALHLHADSTNFLIADAPPEVAAGVIALDNYVTQGYYGLYMSLDEPFIPTFGLGNSMFLTRQMARIYPNFANLPYPVRIEAHGWDSRLLWSSIYPWLASDFSFPGTLVVLFFLGRLLALSWIDTLHAANPFAVALFAQLVIMFFYFPANNQLLQSGEGLTGFVGIFLMWLCTRKRNRKKSLHSECLHLNQALS